MNNASKFYSRLNDIQVDIGNNEYSIHRLFVIMRELVDEAEQDSRDLQDRLTAAESEIKELDALCAWWQKENQFGKVERDQLRAQVEAAKGKNIYMHPADLQLLNQYKNVMTRIHSQQPEHGSYIELYAAPIIPEQPANRVQADYVLDYEYDEGSEDPDLGGDLIFHSLNGKEFPRGTLFYAAPPQSVEISGESDEPVFYYRPTSSGGYEGPIHANSIEKVRIGSGVWKPLFDHSRPSPNKADVTSSDLIESGKAFLAAWDEIYPSIRTPNYTQKELEDIEFGEALRFRSALSALPPLKDE
ncbi:MAG: hypothetical protein ABW044_05365 [Cellvibrio sp.]